MSENVELNSKIEQLEIEKAELKEIADSAARDAKELADEVRFVAALATH